MSDNKFNFRFGDYEILVATEKTSKDCFGKGYCPICAQIYEAEDHKFGCKYVANIVYSRIKSHLKAEHNIKDDN